ncbi:hypothetical protein B0H63DRAFT_496385 [Podospora didyma]|uniref:DUF5672 domain-containing protein n=1 Tax=Podospora didyma TaxID=330526 RepID=A0AAE0N8W9_9PEZI|nr:hypothetical protein B0H63DRAFT_496385 [Podospora didyma]
MAAPPLSTHSPGVFTITRTRVFLVVSLAFTWWFASMVPHYKPVIQEKFQARIGDALQKLPSIKVDWDTAEGDPRDAYNASKVALLIEERPLPHLVPQILHMMSVVPPDWRFLFVGSQKSVVSVGRAYATKHQQLIGKLDLMVLPEPWEISDKEHVFRLLTDLRFYDEFLPGVEWILKYEADSILCANSQTSLNEWLDWHWVGAPRTPDDRFSGNGGLSLRRVSAIRRVLGFQARYNNSEPEDEWFGKRVYILPGARVAAGTDHALAVEDVYIDNAMGYHVRNGGQNLADGVWKDPTQRKKIFDYCPELSLIMPMKLERERCPGDNKQGEIHPTVAEQEAANRKKLLEEAAEKAKQAQEAEANRLASEQAAKAAEENAAWVAKQAEANGTFRHSTKPSPGQDAASGPNPDGLAAGDTTDTTVIEPLPETLPTEVEGKTGTSIPWTA